MTRAVVSDASRLIDLRKGGLLEALCNLPHQLVVPLPVRAWEVLDFSARQWRHLDDHGMVTHDLPPEEIEQALRLKSQHRALSANDCFCFVATARRSGILLTGDATLRKVAAENGLPVHGVLWIVDELAVSGTCPALLIEALRAWESDDTVFLPRNEIRDRVESLRPENLEA